MKTTKQLLFAALVLMFALSSCTIVKRTYMPGWYVDGISSKHTTNSAAKKEVSVKEDVKKPEVEKVMADDNAIASTGSVTEEEKIIANAGTGKNIPAIHLKTVPPETITFAASEKLKSSITAAVHSKKDKKGWFATVIIGILFLLLGWVCLIYIEVIGLILYYIFGIAGVIFIVLGILQLIFA